MSTRFEKSGNRRTVVISPCGAHRPDLPTDDPPEDEDNLWFDGDTEAPWDDFGWDFDDQEPDPEHGDFWTEPDEAEGDA